MNDAELDDLFHDIRNTCGDCEHPRCLGIIATAKKKIKGRDEVTYAVDKSMNEEDMVEMLIDDASVLHLCGRSKEESNKCPIFLDLVKKYKDNGGKCPMKLGDYTATRFPDGRIEYALVRAKK